jgi:spermidine/putrescine transport system substrate-binding protein
MNRKFELIFFYLSRIGMIFIWLLIIAAFLYSPYYTYFFVNKKTINIYTWADMLDSSYTNDFEKQTGIKVNLVYYDNSEELLAKLKISQGQGYDLLVLADSSVLDLTSSGLLAPLDWAKLNFKQELIPGLLNQYYDPQNRYSIPYSWDVYGMGINRSKIDANLLQDPSWSLIFDDKAAINQIGMMEEALKAFGVAVQYLYGQNLSSLDEQQIEQVKNLLIKQKKQVAVYTELLGGYLLSSGACPIVVSQGAYINRLIQTNSDIDFVMPKEGGFVATENFAILGSSIKQDLVYQFINFMYQKQTVQNFVSKTGFLPSRFDVLNGMQINYLDLKSDIFKNIDYFKYIISRDQISKLWIEVKAN